MSAVSVIGVVEPRVRFAVEDGVVVSDTLHSPSLPRAKSKSVAVRDCDERVSAMNTLKHLPPRFFAVRSTPPSKNSEVRSVLPGPSCLFDVGHGVVIEVLMGNGPEFVVAQTASSPAVDLQSTPCAAGVVLSAPPAPPSQRYTSIVLTPPPFVNAETTSRSPSTWFPVNATLGPAETQPALSWRNQKATFPSPVLALRSRPK